MDNFNHVRAHVYSKVSWSLYSPHSTSMQHEDLFNVHGTPMEMTGGML